MRTHPKNLRVRVRGTGIKCFQGTIHVSCPHSETRRGSLARIVSLLTDLRGEDFRKKRLYEMVAVAV